MTNLAQNQPDLGGIGFLQRFAQVRPQRFQQGGFAGVNRRCQPP